MNKGLIITALGLAASWLTAGAQLNASDNSGFMARSAAMYARENYVGCLDQLSRLDRSTMSAQELEEADFLMAQSAFRVSGPRAALPYFRTFLVAWPESMHRAEALMHVGDCLYGIDRYDLAIKAYDQLDPATLNDRLRATLYYRKAYCLMNTGKEDEAAKLFALVQRDKEWGNAARFYLGYMDYLHGRYDQAVEHFKTVNTAVEPGRMADYYLAQIYFMRGEYGQALSTARALLRRSGDIAPEYSAEARRIAGESLYRQGKNGEALEFLRQYLAECLQTPRNSALYIVGMADYADGKYEEAVSLLEPVAASTLQEDAAMSQSANLFIGQALHRLGRKDAALMAFDKALRYDADRDVQYAAYYNYAVAKFTGGNIPFGSSVETFEEILRLFPDGNYSNQVKEYLVAGYLADDDNEKALAGLERIPSPTAKVSEGKQLVLYRLGARALADGDNSRAMEYLTRSRELGRYNAELAAETTLLMGQALSAAGDLGSAAERYNEYLRLASPAAVNRPVALYGLAYTQFGLKDYDAAEKSFRRALESTTDKTMRADILNRLADIRYYASNFPEAAEMYTAAYEANPAAGDYALFQKGLMAGYQRDYTSKVRTLESFRKNFPTSSLLPDALLELTEAYIHQNKSAQAVEIYRELIRDYPSTAQGRQGYVQMALTLLNMGKKAEGIKAYKDVITLYPTSEEAAQAANLLKHIYAEDGNLDDYMAFINGVDGAPKPDSDEAERLTFEAAEREFIQNGSVERLKAFVQRYPSGTSTPRALEMLMDRAASNGKRTQAYEYAQAIVSRFPDHSATERALQLKAQEEYALGRGNTALESWQQLEQRASTPERVNAARMGILRVGRDLGDYALVERAAEAILNSSTAGAEARSEAAFSLALAKANKDDIKDARELWEQYSGDTADLYGAKSAFYLADSYFQSGDLNEALTRANDFANSGTPHKYWLARGFILLSDIYAAQGKDYEAREYLRALRENYPGTEADIFEMIDSRLRN